jgi:Methyltransferase domain
MKNTIKHIFNQLPYVKGLYKQTANFSKNSFYPAGHYYSPIVSVDDIQKREMEIWKDIGVDGITGIDLQAEAQVRLVKELSAYYADLPFAEVKEGKLRYFFGNYYYSYTDGIVLYSMMRHFRPQRIIEVGSGYSSALMMDVNELFFDNKIGLSFVEPYPERLHSLMSEKDKQSSTVIEKPVQEMGAAFFEKLDKGDILFIDSSHVSKCGSDVNYILFEILPVLKSGVFIHFHDIFYPFEYPKDWVLGGKNWNEDYILKAFLLYNEKFKIRLFSHYLHVHHKDAFKDMPLTFNNTGGNIWIEKI